MIKKIKKLFNFFNNKSNHWIINIYNRNNKIKKQIIIKTKIKDKKEIKEYLVKKKKIKKEDNIQIIKIEQNENFIEEKEK